MLTFDTALGTCGITWSDVGITGVLLPGTRGLTRRAAASPPAVSDAIHGTVAAIVALLDGEHTDLRDVMLDETGIDPFRRSVYDAVREIAPGRRPATATSPARLESPTLRARSATRWARTRIRSSSPATVCCPPPARSTGSRRRAGSPPSAACSRSSARPALPSSRCCRRASALKH